MEKEETHKILVIGAGGQIGSDLVPKLKQQYGNENVISLDCRATDSLVEPHIIADVCDKEAMEKIISEHKITMVFHLAAILSAKGEENPQKCWQINIDGLKHVLDLCVQYSVKKVFWPSSIAAFGPTTPRVNTPQQTVLEPTTMYGITKVVGEHLCNYYFLKYGLDIRSVRFPGIISYKTEPGGGTTDYAVAMYYEAIKEQPYDCFVTADTILPMMYIDDAIKSIMDIMHAKKENIKERTSYNLACMSFSAQELAKEIQKTIPSFVCNYKPDFRQNIADSWPQSIDDSKARIDWGWQPAIDIAKMSEIMITNLKEKLL